MELIVIDRNTVKVTLSKKDVKKYGIDEDGYPEEVSHAAIDSIFSDAGLEKDESADYYVECYFSKDGGCELFITKATYGGEKDAELSTSKSKKNVNDRKRGTVYRFERIEDVLGACREISKRPSAHSLLYYDRRWQRYYLITENEEYHAEEFGADKCRNETEYYIKEHCTLVCKDAVDRLKGLSSPVI